MEVYGNKLIKTPYLNQLAKESFVFQKAYVTQPVSTPSRASILTGFYPHTIGLTTNNIPIPDTISCLPRLMNEAEYEYGYLGKWHLGNEIFSQKGFKTWASIEDIYSEFYSGGKDKNMRSSYHHWLLNKGYRPDQQNVNKFSREFASTLPLEHCKPAFLEEKACEFLEKNKHNPFILYVNFLEPHMPFSGPLNDMYKPEEITLPESFTDSLGKNEPIRYKLKKEKVQNNYGTTENDYRKLIGRYWGLVSQVDLSIGGILKKLKELDLDNNTIVVFTSDHGDMMGAHQLVEKSVMYQEAIRIPLLIKIPFITTKPRIIENQVSQIDIIPTLLDLLHIKNKIELQGKSLMPLVQGKSNTVDYVFIEWNPDASYNPEKRGSAVLINEKELKQIWASSTRTVIAPDGWKLCLTNNDNSQLFDLQNDPYEKNNLITNPDYNDKIALLAQKIKEWQKRTSDTLKLPDIESKLMYGFK